MERSAFRQRERALNFCALHERPGSFILPNPWNVGTALLLAQAGFEALATSSAGYASSIGKPDHAIERDEMLAHCASLAGATELPVSGDLGNGFGTTAGDVAETIRQAATAGLVGASIEDAPPDADAAPYALAVAVERVRAAVAAARELPFPFTLTARAENHLRGCTDLADTIERLRAYQAAGADVLYAPGLVSLDDVAAIVSAVDRPVNVLATAAFSVHELSRLGAKRISVGSALERAAMATVADAASEMRVRGTFRFAAR
jgi:2-methylisocitrate lyase-like PEP mutase family enzyme